jgi:hypothetical protein
MNIRSFTDKAGRNWKLSNYAEMVSRTVPMHVMNVGKMNEFLEYGEDLVVVSDFSPTCPLCAPWGGAVLSISGVTKGYPAVSEAEEAGLFHPRCLHSFALYSAEVWGKPDADGRVRHGPSEEYLEREADAGGEPVGEGRVTGASGAVARSDYKRMEKHAKRYYEAIRNRKSESDVEAIARNTGFSVEDVRKIRHHVFMDMHDLGIYGIKRFDPSFDMAVSWQNLADGKNIREMDIVLLHHELEELKLMAQGWDYDTAHRTVEKVYNYQKYVKELNTKEGIF